MKKLALIFLCALLVLGLWACKGQSAQPTDASQDALSATEATLPEATEPPAPTYAVEAPDFTFPAGTQICGVDVSAMTQEEAHAAVCQALSSYTLQLSVNGRKVNITGFDISLTTPLEAIAAYAGAIEKGADPSGIDLTTYDSTLLRSKLANHLNSSAKNAGIRYNAAAHTFQLTESSTGTKVDLASILSALEPVIKSLSTQKSMHVSEETVEPSITADSDTARNALSRANAYLQISLTYSYTPDNTPTRYETISVDTIGSFIRFNDDLSSYISSNALRNYVNEMSKKYSVKGNAGQFKTTGGYYISITVDYAGQPVNVDGLYDDIHYCLSNGISGTRVAPYLEAVECEEMAFDGNYVEVNLSAQYLWVYRNGACVVSTPIVSGCAYYHNTTPTGVYSIYAKSRGVNLVGADYVSYVNYWMPFKGGYGLHDASWRSSFGGDIYLYDGSHGCVNLPSGVAGTVYNNIFVGTKVILYGGATSAEPVQQNIIGTTEYNVPLGTAPFKLDAQPEYGDDKTLTYVSSDPSIASVAEDGTVTVHKPGIAYIGVTAAARQYYTAAQMFVTINVLDPCGQTGHTFGPWVTTVPATCTTAGSQSHTCTVCGAEETEELPALGHSVAEWFTQQEPTCTAPGSQVGVCGTCYQTITQELPAKGHNFSGGGEFCDNGCGTPNPDFLPPKEDEEDPTDPGQETEPTGPSGGGDPDPTEPSGGTDPTVPDDGGGTNPTVPDAGGATDPT